VQDEYKKGAIKERKKAKVEKCRNRRANRGQGRRKKERKERAHIPRF
jgi:hypothetical protein